MQLKLIIYIAIFALGATIGAIITYSLMKVGEDDIQVSHTVLVDKIEALGRLEVVKYNLQDIIEYKKMRQWLPNARTALLVSGEIIVCVDLSKIDESRVNIIGDSITLVLPAPEICHVKVDHSNSKIYDMSYGLWDSADLMDEAYKHAQQELENQAKRIDLSKEARDNTSAVLVPMLNAFGYKRVLILYDV